MRKHGYIDTADRIEIMRIAAENADRYGERPLSLYHAMLAAISAEPEEEKDR